MTASVLDLSSFGLLSRANERGHDESSSVLIPSKTVLDLKQNCPRSILSLALILATMGKNRSDYQR